MVGNVGSIVTCPNCGNKLDKPSKKLENSVFTIAAYYCPKCGTKFKVIS